MHGVSLVLCRTRPILYSLGLSCGNCMVGWFRPSFALSVCCRYSDAPDRRGCHSSFKSVFCLPCVVPSANLFLFINGTFRFSWKVLHRKWDREKITWKRDNVVGVGFLDPQNMSIVFADVDECSYGSHNCDVNARCINTPGSFACICSPCYEGDGISCTSKGTALVVAAISLWGKYSTL